MVSDGHDSRFDGIRDNPWKFAGAFVAQGTWISLCLFPVIGLCSIPGSLISRGLPLLTTTDAVGLGLFAGGFAFEVVADRQKAAWVADKKAKRHEESFLTRGLWGRSRHPNYFGEITLWSGIAVTCWGVLSSPVGLRTLGMGGLKGMAAAAGVCAVSPAFVMLLLMRVSGIRPSEGNYDERYGGREDYRRWKRETPVLVPRLW